MEGFDGGDFGGGFAEGAVVLENSGIYADEVDFSHVGRLVVESSGIIEA